LIFWSGTGASSAPCGVHRIWIRRCRCQRCERSHALIPSFLLIRRFDPAPSSGLPGPLDLGVGLRTVAAALDVPHTTVRDWRLALPGTGRWLTAGFGSLAVALAGQPLLSANPEGCWPGGTGRAWDQARAAFGASVPPFDFASS